MLSINIETIGVNRRLILTMITIIIHTERERERERESNNRFKTLSLRIGHGTIR